jgi:hypothetical protein
MNQPFSGQYLAEYLTNDGKKGFLTLNVDPDKNGVGLAYLTGVHEIGFAVYDCTVWKDEAGLISGRAKRSENREKWWVRDRILSDNDQREISFSISTLGDFQKISIQDGDSTYVVPLVPVAQSGKAVVAELLSWKDFLEWVSLMKYSNRRSIFRGVASATYSLKTSFHRTDRVDLERYRDLDLPAFVDLAETIGHINFDGDNGAKWGFAQHHGFPTPLLDWTESPYIAAYFAFHERVERRNLYNGEKVKIYCLNGDFVNENQPRSVSMTDFFPRILVFKPNTKGNQRLVFQQGLFLHSNVVEIEAFLIYLSSHRKSPYVSVVEMSAELALEAVDQLSYMGISHLSLFPGLDGAAKHAALKQFYLNI